MFDDSPTTPVESTETPPHNHDSIAPIVRYFNIEADSPKAIEKAKLISEFLRGDKKEYSEVDMVRDMKDTLFKLGTPALGESVLDRLYSFAKVQSQIRSLEEERSRLIR